MCLLPEPDIGFGKLNSRECDGMSERDMSNTRGSSELIGQMKRAGTERKPSPVLAVYSLAKRELVRFFRQRTRIVGALGQPIIFWILFDNIKVFTEVFRFHLANDAVRLKL